jgi:hypothetical protein
MGSVKTIGRLITAVLLLAWLVLYIMGYRDGAMVMLTIALFAAAIVFGIQLSASYHDYFVKRRRE